MLLFSTILKINSSFTPEAFGRSVIEWNQGGPHKENVIPDISWNGEWDAFFGNERLWLEFAQIPDLEIYAARYEKVSEDGAVWDTDYIADFANRTISIRLERSFLEDATSFQEDFSTPYYIKTLIRDGYLEMDGDTSVDFVPKEVTESEKDWLLGILKGKRFYALPIVYVTRKPDGELPLDARFLAHKLKGAAHVIVEGQGALSLEIHRDCGKKYECNGRIGIYYLKSESERKHRYFKPLSGEEAPERFMDRLVNEVIRYALIRRPADLETWNGVNRVLLQRSLNEQKRLRSEAEAARAADREFNDKLLEEFDDDSAQKDRKIQSLMNENASLQEENLRLKEKFQKMGHAPVLYFGDETELFADEIKDLLLTILSEARKNVHDDTHRAHVLDDIIGSNEYGKITEKRREKIKALLKDYKSMSGALRQELTDFGFQITEDGSHYKLTYYGDPRYMFVIAKTGSDYRGGRNDSAQIARGVL